MTINDLKIRTFERGQPIPQDIVPSTCAPVFGVRCHVARPVMSAWRWVIWTREEVDAALDYSGDESRPFMWLHYARPHPSGETYPLLFVSGDGPVPLTWPGLLAVLAFLSSVACIALLF